MLASIRGLNLDPRHSSSAEISFRLVRLTPFVHSLRGLRLTSRHILRRSLFTRVHHSRRKPKLDSVVGSATHAGREQNGQGLQKLYDVPTGI